MKILEKEFLLFPDDLSSQDIEEGICSVNANRQGIYVRCLDGNSSLELATRIASGFPASTFMNQGRFSFNENSEGYEHSVLIRSGRDGGLFIYHWSSTDRLVLPVIRGRLLISRGDLEWIESYTFIHKLDFHERTISFNCCISEHDDTSSTSIFLTSRIHFGHLARDTIAGEAYLAQAYIKKCCAFKNHASFSFLDMQEKYLDDQLRFSLSLLFKQTTPAIRKIAYSPVPAGNAIIIKSSLLFVRTLSPAFPCFGLQNELNLPDQSSKSALPVAHLGIKGFPHRRILNQIDMNRFLELRNIPSIESDYTPAQRHSLLTNAQVVIAEPSSSIYNYILNCLPDTLCILLLPGSFELELTHRDCCDWYFLIKHLTTRRVVPFYGDRVCTRKMPTGRSTERLIDLPTRYDMKKLGDFIQECLENKV